MTYVSIETVNTNNSGPYHLKIDSTLAGSYGNQTADPDDTPDQILVRVDGADLVIERSGSSGSDAGDFVGQIFRGKMADILSLFLQGSGDDETVTISDAGGLPSFSARVPLGPNNPLVGDAASGDPPTLPNMLFVAGGRHGRAEVSVDRDGTDQTYGLGDGAGRRVRGGYARRAQGEVLTTKRHAAGWICTSRAWKRR